MAYPFYEKLQSLSRNMTVENFGLWYNKFVPVKDFDSCKTSDERGNENNAVPFYYQKYNSIQKNTISKLLGNKHMEQTNFCDALLSGYETVLFKAKLKTPLITGIGESHPHEVSMVFDHNMGIPYVPSSGIKGIVRFVHTLGLIGEIPEGKLLEFKDGKPCSPYFDDEEDWTDIPRLFGTQNKRGSVVFLDAYPEKVPDLHVDIMNPHYGKYYNENSPPADYLDPNPIKFLTVAKDTIFIFRALVDKKQPELINEVKNALNKALTDEGVGAKTAVGYGIFEICDDKTLKITAKADNTEEDIKLIDTFIVEIKRLKPSDAGPIGSVIDRALKLLETDDEKRQFALAVKEHMGKTFKKSKARKKLGDFLD